MDNPGGSLDRLEDVQLLRVDPVTCVVIVLTQNGLKLTGPIELTIKPRLIQIAQYAKRLFESYAVQNPLPPASR